MSVKNPLRNFGEAKTNRNNISPSFDSTSLTIQLTRIGKMLEDSILKFTKRYLIISTELEEMKREFIGQVSLVGEFLNLTKKEIRFEKYDSFNQGKYSNISNIPLMPNYEQKAILRGENKSFYNRINNNNINLSNNNRVNSNSKTKSSNSMNSRVISPDMRKMKSSSAKSIRDDKGNYNNLRSQKYKKNKNKIRNDKNNFNYNNYHFKKDEILDSLSDNQSKSIFILIENGVLPYKEKIKLLFTKKSILNNIKPRDILINELRDIQNKIQNLKSKKINEEDKKIINKIISYPSKTAKTGLNFLTAERENELINNDIEVNLILLKMIYSCLNEEYLSNNIKEGYEYLFKKYNVNSIKYLFLNIIYKKVFNDSLNDESNQNADKIINDISENKMLMTNNLVNNTNKTFSYLCFSLDEICEFLKEIKELNKEMRNNIKNELELKRLLEQEQEIKKQFHK